LGGQGSLTGHSHSRIGPCGSTEWCGPRQPSGRTSGSRTSLPRPGPLRTGRDDCSSSGSSLCRLVSDPPMAHRNATAGIPVSGCPAGLSQASSQPLPVLRRPTHHAIEAGGGPARVLPGHPADHKPLGGSEADQELRQALHLPSISGRRGTVDPTLQSPHGSLHRSPINVGPRRLPPLAGLFGLHRLTSPAIPSSARLPNRRDHGGSQPPFGSGIPSSPRPYPPHYRAAFACSAAPLPPPPSPPLRSGYRRLAAAGRVGLTLLSNGERWMGRLRPVVRRVLLPPSSTHRDRRTDPYALFGSGLSAPLAG
jgi:hypothetical protein